MKRTAPLGLTALLGSLALGASIARCDSGTGGVFGAIGGGTSAGAGGSRSGGLDLGRCRECAGDECPTEDSQCASAAGCVDMLRCYMNCSRTDVACMTNCIGS